MANTEIKNEVMDTVIEDVVVEEVVNKANNMKNLILKGGLVIAGVAAVAVLVKKGIDVYKAKKALHQPDKEIIVEAEDIEEVIIEE